jgi:hypothetical protein
LSSQKKRFAAVSDHTFCTAVLKLVLKAGKFETQGDKKSSSSGALSGNTSSSRGGSFIFYMPAIILMVSTSIRLIFITFAAPSAGDKMNDNSAVSKQTIAMAKTEE